MSKVTTQVTTQTATSQDLYIPLSENLIIGFFFDMIHDFPESSTMTGDFRTDVDYFIKMFDAVFGKYWKECNYVLKEIVEFLNYQHYKIIIEKEKVKEKEKEK